MRIVEPQADLLWITPDAECVIEAAGRTCYKSENMITESSAGKFIKMIMARGHESVIEHAAASFRFVCDRGVTHELVRHRLASYSQESTRYCNYGKDKFGNEITVIQPPGLSESAIVTWKAAMEKAESAYFYLLTLGAKPQIARSVLPICLKTEIVTTCNLREWRHIFRLRTSAAAHPQIKKIMDEALSKLRERCPNVFEDI